MSRPVDKVYRLQGVLKATTAISVAHGDDRITDDIVCIRDGMGRLVIPGTALAGVLRHRLGQNAIWGDKHDPNSPDPPRPSDPLTGSAVWVEDCVARPAGHTAPRVERRDGVRIDRHTGAAATGALYSREVVPAGTTFSVAITVEEAAKGAPGREPGKDVFRAIAAQLADGVRVGGATSRGLGRLTLVTEGKARAKATCEKVGTRAGMLRRLTGEVGDPVDLAGDTAVDDRITIEIPWRPRGPLLVKVAANGLVDAVPLTTRDPGGGHHFVIPGSSVKGVLRARAERILRTLGDTRAQEPSAAPGNSQHLSLVEALFGTAALGGGRRSGWGGVLTVDDRQTQTAPKWDAVLSATGVEVLGGGDTAQQRRRAIVAARKAARTAEVEIIDHVAIDRWTGGSDDGKLFSLVAPLHDGPQWSPMRMEVDIKALLERVDPRAAFALLALLIRDLAEGDLPLGHGTTRGYGEITGSLGEAAIRIGRDVPAELGLSDLDGRAVAVLFAAPDLSTAVGQAVAAVQEAWADHVASLSTPSNEETSVG